MYLRRRLDTTTAATVLRLEHRSGFRTLMLRGSSEAVEQKKRHPKAQCRVCVVSLRLHTVTCALRDAHQTSSGRHHPAYRPCRKVHCAAQQAGQVAMAGLFCSSLRKQVKFSWVVCKRRLHLTPTAQPCCRNIHHLGRLHEGYTGIFTMIAHSIVRCGVPIYCLQWTRW